MTSEMGQMFNEIKAERKEERRKRREAFKGGPGWTQHHDTHWSLTLLGSRLDYWPGPKRWRWLGKTMTGDVMQFISAWQGKGKK